MRLPTVEPHPSTLPTVTADIGRAYDTLAMAKEMIDIDDDTEYPPHIEENIKKALTALSLAFDDLANSDYQEKD